MTRLSLVAAVAGIAVVCAATGSFSWCFDLHDQNDPNCVGPSSEVCTETIDACQNFGPASIKIDCAENSSTSAWVGTSYTAADCPAANIFSNCTGTGNGCFNCTAIGGFIDVRCDETVGDGNNEANCSQADMADFRISHDLHGATDSNCTDESQNRTSNSGECINTGGTSIKVVCESQTAGSDWTFAVFRDPCCEEADLEGRVSGTGAQCVQSPELSNFYASVDCTAYGVAEGCFSDSATVTLADGSTVPVSALSVGDRVLAADGAGNTFFDKVFRITHWEADATATFARVATEGGRTLELTPDHRVHSGDECCSYDSMTEAGALAAGDAVFVADAAAGGLVRDTVASVELATKRGVYNAHTISGNMIVSGVAATHYSAASVPSSALHAAVSPAWHRVVDLAGSVLGHEDAKAAAQL